MRISYQYIGSLSLHPACCAKLVNFDFKKGNLHSRLKRLAVFKNL